jgi:hypothetical protein
MSVSAKLLEPDGPMPPFMLVSRDPKVLELPQQGSHYTMVCWAPKVTEEELKAIDSLHSYCHIDDIVTTGLSGSVPSGASAAETLSKMFEFREILPRTADFCRLRAQASLAFNAYGKLRPSPRLALARRWPNYRYHGSFPLAHYDSDTWTLIANFSRTGSYVIDTEGLDREDLSRRGLLTQFADRARIPSPQYEALEGRVYQLPGPSFAILQGDENIRPCLHDWPHQPSPVRVTFVA